MTKYRPMFLVKSALGFFFGSILFGLVIANLKLYL
jgi:hypothetical protein